MLNKKIKAFTLAEMLVTLALTSMLVTFSYMGLNYIQKLLYQFNDQSFFITQLNELNERINIVFNESKHIEQKSEGELVFKSDSLNCQLSFKPLYIQITRHNKADTFNLEYNDLKTEKEPLSADCKSVLLKKLEFDIYFQKQKFHLIFIKNYDAYSKMLMETANGNY